MRPLKRSTRTTVINRTSRTCVYRYPPPYLHPLAISSSGIILIDLIVRINGQSTRLHSDCMTLKADNGMYSECSHNNAVYAAIGQTDIDPLTRFIAVVRWMFTKELRYVRQRVCKPYSTWSSSTPYLLAVIKLIDLYFLKIPRRSTTATLAKRLILYRD